MKHDELVGWGCNAVSTIATIAQTDEMFRLIQIILTCIGVLVSLAYTIWKWYRTAKKDGKITKDEVDELFDDINRTIEIKEEEEDDRDKRKEV